MRGLERRLARLEAKSAAREAALVAPETLRMAAVHDAVCARVREKLFGDGPHDPAPIQNGVESNARRILREKLLRDDSAA